MTDEQVAAIINARAMMAFAEVNKMIAANQKRESEGLAQAYGEESFAYIRDDLEKALDEFNLR